MVRYLKYIVLIFGSIGVMAASFFYYQNRNDISVGLEYRDIIDYEYLKEHCLGVEKSYYYPCLKEKYIEYLAKVSFTGTNFGLRMMFNVMDHDKSLTTKFETDDIKNIHYSINFLEVNNLAMHNAYQRYLGLDALYGGYLATLREYYPKAQLFSTGIITGLESAKGLESLSKNQETKELKFRFELARKRFYAIKKESQEFIDSEIARIESSQSK
jgi:hypothetical protein